MDAGLLALQNLGVNVSVIVNFFEPVIVPVKLSQNVVDNITEYRIRVFFETKTGYSNLQFGQLDHTQNEGLWINESNPENLLVYYSPDDANQIEIELPEGIYTE